MNSYNVGYIGIGGSKIGQVYTYMTERTMLEVANSLEKKGYKVKRGRSKFGSFTVTVIGYR